MHILNVTPKEFSKIQELAKKYARYNLSDGFHNLSDEFGFIKEVQGIVGYLENKEYRIVVRKDCDFIPNYSRGILRTM